MACYSVRLSFDAFQLREPVNRVGHHCVACIAEIKRDCPDDVCGELRPVIGNAQVVLDVGGLKSVCIYGGVPKPQQKADLRAGAEVSRE